MAKSTERKIVDVRDLFGEKKEKIDLPELIGSSSPSSPSSKSTPSPGALFGGGGFGGAAFGGYKPKACGGTNENVFFGGAPSGGKPEGRRGNSNAPKSPVLVDIDVGIDEQQIIDFEDDSFPQDLSTFDPPESSSGSPWSFGPPKKSTSSSSRDQLGPRGAVGPPRGEAGVSSVGVKGQVHNSQQYSVNDQRRGRQPPLTSGAVEVTNGQAHLKKAEQQHSKPISTNHQDLNVNGLMSNFSLGQRPGDGGFGNRGGGGLNSRNEFQKDKKHIYIDQSSSGVETDENSTPEGTAILPKSVAMSKRPLPPIPPQSPPPPPPPPPPLPPQSIPTTKQERHLNNDYIVNNSTKAVPSSNNQGVDSSYHSEEASDAEDEGSNFYEDEATLEFEDEDEEGHHMDGGNRRLIYHEYQGDDFGQFLNEEQAAGEQGNVPRGKKKKLRRRKKREVTPSSGNSTASVSSGEATVNKKRTLKGRIAAVFMGNGNSANPKETPPQGPPRRFDNGNTIHSFSFADSKIGNSLSQPGNNSHVNRGSGSDLVPCDAAYGGDRKWWKTDTLSARTLQSNSDVMLMPRRTGADTGTTSSNFSFKKTDSSKPENFDSDVINEEQEAPDFESLRKSVIYGISDDKKSRRGSLFQRLKKDSKSNNHLFQDNTVTNPLAGLQ